MPHEHATRNVSAALVERADAIFCMTGAQCRTLSGRFPDAVEKIERLDPISDLADPGGQPPEIVVETARRIRDAVRWRLAGDRTAAFAEA